MKKVIAMLLVLLMVCTLFTACAGTTAPAEEPADSTAKTDTPAPSTSDSSPTADADEPAFTELNLMCFTGGYGDMWQELADLFSSIYPDVTVNGDFSNDVESRARAVMLTDTPPDILFISGSTEYDVCAAAASGQLMDLDDFFANGVNSDGDAMSEVVSAARIDSNRTNGAAYLVPWSTGYGGWWYNKALFDAHGWTAPTTWDELLALAPQIEAEGIIPFMYQNYTYAIWGYMYQAVAAAGGYDAYADCFINLKEGAWLSDAALEAATNMYNLSADGYLSKASVGIDFTQAQVDFVNDRVALIPCGTWFENEMKDATPDGFEMTFLPFPAEDDDGYHYLTAFDTTICVPAKANNPEAAKAFLGVLYSKEGQKIVAKYGSYPVSNMVSADDVAEYLTPGMITALDAANAGSVKFVSNNPENWYAAMWPTLADGIQNLTLNDITPEEFCQSMEDAATMVREDDSIVKYSSN